MRSIGSCWIVGGRLERALRGRGGALSGTVDTVGTRSNGMSGSIGSVNTMNTDDTKNITPVTLRLPDDLRRRIRVLAAEEDKSAQQWMREALELVVDRVEAAKRA